MDGFDVASIAFASPGIAREWGIARGALGFVFSMDLIGMGLASFLHGGLADNIGRRPTLLACLVVIGSGSLLAAIVLVFLNMDATQAEAHAGH